MKILPQSKDWGFFCVGSAFSLVKVVDTED